MRISRRLFVVLLAENDHGKSTMTRALVGQGLGVAAINPHKGRRPLVSPWGRVIDAYVFIRSYQEVEQNQFGSVENALDQNDPDWRTRELIILPSHVVEADTLQMIDVAHSGGFDVICATVVLDPADRQRCQQIWQQRWDERWTLPNPRIGDDSTSVPQIEAIGRDLWVWICRALAS